MSNNVNPNRVKPGVPTGGQFAANNRTECAVSLQERREQPGWYYTSNGEQVNAATGFTDAEFGEVTKAYFAAAIWTSADDSEPEEGDDEVRITDDFTDDDISEGLRAQTNETVFKFLSENKPLIDEARLTDYSLWDAEGYGLAGRIGHDLWLTRNHLGVGFWDREPLRANGLGDRLTEAAQKLGELDIYASSDGKVHAE